jgi:hypothetical protein
MKVTDEPIHIVTRHIRQFIGLSRCSLTDKVQGIGVEHGFSDNLTEEKRKLLRPLAK